MGSITKKTEIAFILFCGLFVASCTTRHYLLITKDYGILTQGDLNWEAEFAPTNQTAKHRPAYYHAWQCFPLKHYEIYCDVRDYEVTQEMIDRHEPVGPVILKIQHDREILEFSTKRPYEFETCFEIEKEWKKIFDSQRYGCVAGEHLKDEVAAPNDNINLHGYWEIRQIKSKTGYWTFFSRRNFDADKKYGGDNSVR